MAMIYALLTPGKQPRAYVGCTKGKLAKRWREHRCLLKAGRHTCRRLQDDWANSTFVQEYLVPVVLEVLPDGADTALKRERELHWMQKFSDTGLLYNEHLVSFAPTPEATRRGVEASRHVEGRKRSPEANLKRSLAQKGKPKGHGAKISATKRARRLQQVMI